MKQLNLKKLVLLNLPYFLLGLFATNLGEAWRLATGADASAKMLSFFSTLPVALGSWWPSLHPLDLPWGFAAALACAGGVSERQERQEVPPQRGVWFGPLECIILSVKDTYMDAQEVMHMTDYSKITALYSRLSVGDEDRDGGESNSIQNQKIFLENYARGQHLTISGTTLTTTKAADFLTVLPTPA